MYHCNEALVTIAQVTVLPFIRCTEEAVMSDEDFASHRRKLREMLAEKTKPCPVTWRTEDGKVLGAVALRKVTMASTPA
jgi:hypothetical protein